MRRLLPTLVVVAVAVAAGSAGPAVGGAPVPVLVIDGRGFGHGVGMAQDGAYWMGRGGATTAQILNQFYPGTRFGRSSGEVRVVVSAGPANQVVLGFPGGGEVRDAREGSQSPGFPVRVPAGGRARLSFEGGRYNVQVVGTGVAAASAGDRGRGSPAAAGRPLPLSGGSLRQQPTTTTLPLLPTPETTLLPLPSTPPAPTPPGPVTTTTAPAAPTRSDPAPIRAASTRGLWAVPAGGGTVDVVERARRYRGVVQATAGGGLRLVNHVDVEQYLRGMGEVRDPGWPAAALRAQAIAARTYAMRALAGGGELCDHQQCQVYLGAQAEYAAMDKAVSATGGQVLIFGRGLAAAVYSANGGGFSATTEEGFGTAGAGYPYLRAARYPTQNPSPWTVTVALGDVASRLGYRGRVTGMRTVAAGPSGRVLQVTLDGSSGNRSVSGIDFDKALGLRSTMFSLRIDTAASPPPPPPPPDAGFQALPDVEGATAGATGPPPGPAMAAPVSPTATTSPVSPADPRTRLVGAVAWLLLAAAIAATAGIRRCRRQGS